MHLRDYCSGVVGSIARFIKHGCPPGSFVEALLRDNLGDTFACADHHNSQFIREIVEFVYNNVPLCARYSNNYDEYLKLEQEKRDEVWEACLCNGYFEEQDINL